MNIVGFCIFILFGHDNDQLHENMEIFKLCYPEGGSLTKYLYQYRITYQSMP